MEKTTGHSTENSEESIGFRWLASSAAQSPIEFDSVDQLGITGLNERLLRAEEVLLRCENGKVTVNSLAISGAGLVEALLLGFD